MVDADPQCNLSGLVMGFRGESDFENFYATETKRNIRAGLAPAFESQPKAIEAVDCLPISGCDGPFLTAWSHQAYPNTKSHSESPRSYLQRYKPFRTFPVLFLIS